MCVNSFNLHRSKYRRRKGGTEGAWGRDLLRAEAAEEDRASGRGLCKQGSQIKFRTPGMNFR